MTRTCIVCSNPAHSREHIFPASLGGRRVNKGIYCEKHNNEYSPLANIIAEQMAIFNSLLGITNDHTGNQTAVELEEAETGRRLILQGGKLTLKIPEIVSEHVEGSTTRSQMKFASREQMNAWIKQQEQRGFKVEIKSISDETYIPTPLLAQTTFGGTNEGLRSIGYIAQTFFAHYFPEVIRRSDFEALKQYTLVGDGQGFVWWQFEKPQHYPPNKFRFGHRVVVGLDKNTATAYAIVELFSTLCFAIELGSTKVENELAFLIDIDPLSPSPPHDISQIHLVEQTLAIPRPNGAHRQLADAITGGTAQSQVASLMRRIEDYQREDTARKILKILDRIEPPRLSDSDYVFDELGDLIRPRVIRLMRFVAADFSSREDAAAKIVGKMLDEITRADHHSSTGLTPLAATSLEVGSRLLTLAIVREYNIKQLSVERLQMLISGGAGIAIVMKPFFDMILELL